MKKIKIITGSFGYMPDGAKSVLLKDTSSEPFDVADAIADRLVKKRIADIVEEAADVVIAYDDKMTKTQLAEIGAKMGVDLPGTMTKKEMLAALDAAIAAADAPEDPEDPEAEASEDPEDPEVGSDDVPPAVAPADPA